MSLLDGFSFFFNPSFLITKVFTLWGGGSGGGGGGGNTTSTSYSTNLPEYAKPYYQELLKQTGKEVFQTDARGNVTGMRMQELPPQTIEGFSPEQQQLQRQVMSYTGSNVPRAVSNDAYGYGSRAMNVATGNTADYMSPYIQGALNPQIEELRRQSLIDQRNANLRAAAAGGYGGARGAFLQSEIARNAQQNIGNVLGKGYQSAFEAAAARQKDLGALGLGSLELATKGATEQQKLDFERYQAQTAAGQAEQAQRQREADIAYQNKMAQLNRAKNQLQFYSDVLRGNAGALGSTQVQYSPAPSTASQIGSLGLAGLGLYKALGNS